MDGWMDWEKMPRYEENKAVCLLTWLVIGWVVVVWFLFNKMIRHTDTTNGVTEKNKIQRKEKKKVSPQTNERETHPVPLTTFVVSPCGKSAAPLQGRLPTVSGLQVVYDTLPFGLSKQAAHIAPAAPVSNS